VPDAIEEEHGRSYTLRNIFAAIAMIATVATAVATYGQWLAPNIAAQEKQPDPNTERPFTLKNGFSGKCLDDMAFSKEDGVKMVQYTCNGKVNQRWYWTADRSIRSAYSGKCLDAYAFGTMNGTDVVQYACNGKANQHWSLAQDANGNPVLRSAYSGKCLDDFGHSKEDGNYLVIWQCNDLPNQIWINSPLPATPA